MKFLLTARPTGKSAIEAVIARSADISELSDLGKIGPLPKGHVGELAVQALGDESAQYADRLVRVSWDCPLVTVIGGRLIREKQLRPELVTKDEEFRRAVFTRFAEELTKALPGNPELWRTLLVLISALGPVRPTQAQLREVLAAFLKIEPWDLMERLALLEQSGLLLRRGGLVQVAPDVLGDYLLDSACVTAGQDNGFAKRLFEHFVSIQGANLVRNLAEVQWRIDQTERHPQLLEGIWSSIKAEFNGASVSGRIQILKIVEEAAVYQPSQALEIVRMAIDADQEIVLNHVQTT